MNKNLFFVVPVLLFLAACGSTRLVPTAPAVVNPSSAPAAPAPLSLPNAPKETPIDINALPPVDEGEMNGPNLPPEIPATQYLPYIRRANVPAPAMIYPDNSCHLAVEVRNYDGTDGCGILLETDTGVLLLVGSTPRGKPLEAGTRISIGWEIMRDFNGQTCPNADAVIRITCMRLLRVSSGLPRPVVCEAYDKPSRWLFDLAKGYSATYVTRFPWKGDRFVYLMESPSGQYLYDCRGYLICQPRKNCLGFIEDFSEGVIIYEG